MEKPAPRPIVLKAVSAAPAAAASSRSKESVASSVVETARRSVPRAGTTINGKYLVEQVLGEGGVGVVVAAQNVELDERVALKFLRAEMVEQPEIVARFAREAKAACSIRSEYVCSVYDVGTTEDGLPFLVMEYLEGENLEQVVRRRGRLGIREATEFAMQACEALAVAHAKRIVHRDIKPENLFQTFHAGMPIVKVLDFGISKTALTGSVFGSSLPLVRTVNLMGSPFYMSPEQVRATDAVDARSDIWSLGMTLYEILTGTLPFKADSITEVCAAILERPLEPIARHRDDLSPEFVAVLDKCLEKDVQRRYQNVAELAIALMPFAPSRARICAERAAQALRAAGMIDESSVRFTSERPSAAGISGREGITSGIMSIPALTPGSSVSDNVETLLPPPEAAAAGQRKDRGVPIATAVVVGGLILAGGAFAVSRSRPAETPTAASAAPSAPATSTTVARTPAAAAEPSRADSTSTSTTEPASLVGSASAQARAPSASVTGRAAALPRPASGPTGKPISSATAAPASPPPPSETKSSTEPDMGY